MILELLMSLSLNDYRDLAKAVQVEAASNTADEYCVAASILNRVVSDRFPNTVSEVVYAPMQYEGIYTRESICCQSKTCKQIKLCTRKE